MNEHLPPLILLEGTPEARGQRLAEALGAEAARGMRFFSRMVGRYAALTMPWLPRWVGPGLDWALGLLGRGVVAGYDDDFRGVLQGMAGALGAPGGGPGLARAHASLDLLLMGSALTQRMAPAPACSCIAALPGTTARGGLVVGRNFDLPPYRADAPPSWLVLERPGRGVPHLSLYHAPGYLPGITGINQAGIICTVLMNFPARVRWTGAPILALSKRVIEESRSLDDARRILAALRPAAGWTFFLADAGRGDARCFETGRDGLGELVPEEGLLFAANRYRSAALVGQDHEPAAAWREHNLAREARLLSLLRERRGQIDAAFTVDLLGDDLDPSTGAPRVGPSIAAPHNVGSAVFLPGEDTLYVASGGWPANTCGTYVGLSISALFRGQREPREVRVQRRDASVQDAAAAYVRAIYRLLVEGDERACLRALDAAVTARPEEPLYRLARGALRLRVGEAEAACEDLAAAAARETWPARRAHLHLLWGFALDWQGAREEARTHYTAALDGEPKVAQAARRGLRRPQGQRGARFPFDPVLATPA